MILRSLVPMAFRGQAKLVSSGVPMSFWGADLLVGQLCVRWGADLPVGKLCVLYLGNSWYNSGNFIHAHAGHNTNI